MTQHGPACVHGDVREKIGLMCEQVDQVFRMYMQVAGKSKSRNEVDIEKPFCGRRRSLECLSLEKFQEIFH